jgi:fibronectin-binding autotransporter adhesin
MIMKTHRLILLAAGIAALLAAAPAFAATSTWTGNAGNNSWNNSGNWSPVVQPANNGTADIIFGATPRPTPDLTLPWNVNSLTFNNTAPSYFLSSTLGNTLTIGAGGITNFDTDFQTITHAITLGAAQTWKTFSGPLYIDGAVNNGGNLLTIDGANTTSLEGAIGGTGGLTKNGLGSLFVQAVNNYAGLTTVNAGQLLLFGGGGIPGDLNVGDGVGTDIDSVVQNISNRIADISTVSVFSTGYWNLNSTSDTITNLNIVSTDIAGGGLITIGSGRLTILGDVTMTGGTVNTANAGTLQLNGGLVTNPTGTAANISSRLDLGNGARTLMIADGAAANDLDVTGVVFNGDIIKDGAGALRLAGANTFAGGTTLNAGTLALANDDALGTGTLTLVGGVVQADGAPRTIPNAVNISGVGVVSGSVDLTLSGPISGASALTKTGSGTLTLSGVNDLTGGITIAAGTLAQSGGTIPGVVINQASFVYSGGTFSGQLVNQGSASFNADFTAGNGVVNQGTITVGNGLTIALDGSGLDNQATLALSGGTIAGTGVLVNNALLSGNGTLAGSGGFTNNAQLTVSGGTFTLANAGPNANAGNLNVSSGQQLRLTGGMLANTATVDLVGGIVAGTATLSNNAGGIVSGRGTISAPFTNAGLLDVESGTLNITLGSANSGEILLGGGLATLGGAGAITNTGLIRGEGKISKTINNNAGGQIRAEPGKSLTLTGSGNTNSGQINLYGGLLEITQNLTNNAGGFISGNGTLIVGNGLTNNGTMNFSGSANVVGNTTNSVGAKIISSGGGPTTFFDDVTNQGEIRTTAGSFTVFFGSASGSGSYTGTGTVNFEGDLKPGNSPAHVNFAGDVLFGSAAKFMVEIGGVAPGSQYDQIQASGKITLDGVLNVSLINGFSPSSGNTFDILDWGSVAGTFSSLQLPTLSGGLQWNSSQLYITGVLSVSLPGDYNQNGKVDAADYVLWRKSPGTYGGNPAGYNAWRANFGQPPGSGSGTVGTASAAVPEPTASVLLISMVASLSFLRRKATLPSQKVVDV